MPRKILTPEELGALIRQYRINFEGPLPPSDWPAPYAETFQTIRNIGRLQYEDYRPNEWKTVHDVEEAKRSVRKINRTAYSCRRQRLNEDGWRLRTEPRIVSRFEAEVIWSASEPWL